MPISYEIGKASGLLLAKGVGSIIETDIAAFVDALLADPEYVHRKACLADFTEASIKVPSDRILELARLHGERLAHATPARIAVVVPGDLSYGLARMYAHYRSVPGVEVAAFRDEVSAMAWLEGGEDEEA
jgi:hypothetical protein